MVCNLRTDMLSCQCVTVGVSGSRWSPVRRATIKPGRRSGQQLPGKLTPRPTHLSLRRKSANIRLGWSAATRKLRKYEAYRHIHKYLHTNYRQGPTCLLLWSLCVNRSRKTYLWVFLTWNMTGLASSVLCPAAEKKLQVLKREMINWKQGNPETNSDQSVQSCVTQLKPISASEIQC